MACLCFYCNGKGKHTYPIYEECQENDEGAMHLLYKFIRVVGNREVECNMCKGTGVIYRKSIPNSNFG